MGIGLAIKNMLDKLIFKKAHQAYQNDLWMNLNNIRKTLLDKTIKKEELIKIKKEIEDLTFKKESLKKIYEASQALSIKKEIEKLDEKILEKQTLMEIYRLERLKLRMFKNFYKKLKIIDSKSNKLKNSLNKKDYEKIPIKAFKETLKQKTKVEKEIEAIKEEVLKAIKKLEA